MFAAPVPAKPRLPKESVLRSSGAVRWYWPQDLRILRERFFGGSPFPHLVLDNVFDTRYLVRIHEEIPEPQSSIWTSWGSGGEESCNTFNSKRGISSLLLLGEATCHFLRCLNTEEFVTDVCAITGEPILSVDHTFNGGGLHCTGRGGRLRVHADKVRHPRPALFDQAVNLILFVQPHWREEYGGQLEFWSKDAGEKCISISPMFNRLVLFRSDRESFHGHPEPLRCPEGMYRSSLAVYYYRPREERQFPEGQNEIAWRGKSGTS